MRRLLKRLATFFLPPEGTPRWLRVLPYAVLGALTLIVLTGSVYAWDYTNSSEFCGTTCHTMPPEYTAYLSSPHARVQCVECHIGRGFFGTRFTRKAGDIKHIVSLVFEDYQYPIVATDLRPARETCEKCHFPEKFSDDTFKQIVEYGNDPQNTASTIYLTLKTGGGSKRQGLGKGIHWHIENQVYYLATDQEEQNIPYVKVVEDDGSVTTYKELGLDITPTDIPISDLKEMDCITCHNRITHLDLTPEESVDQLMSRGVISPTIPEIHERAVQALDNTYQHADLAMDSINALDHFYQVAYPDFYANNQALIKQAIDALTQTYEQSVFPDQKTDWTSHPNNIGHQDSPGCFRCHDGKHLNEQGQAIRLECNLCHSIPVVAGPNDLTADVQIYRGPEPASHQNSNWITLHRDAFDGSCANCHTTDDPGGVSNTSFCSNSACHGQSWQYAGFDAPELRAALQSQLPPTSTPAPTMAPNAPLTFTDSVGPIFESRCSACHHAGGGSAGLDLTSYAGVMKGGNDGPVVVPGDPANSLLIAKQSADTPHYGQLTPDELDLVQRWIAAGAPETQ
jgi:nitrate/TMAO reductase-like tetraheme cytochrome c subunit